MWILCTVQNLYGVLQRLFHHGLLCATEAQLTHHGLLHGLAPGTPPAPPSPLFGCNYFPAITFSVLNVLSQRYCTTIANWLSLG